ncbi:hypothetical protein ACLK1T_19970 [Escherichia coli]
MQIRKILRAKGSEIRLRMWLYPWLTWLVIGFITFVLVVSYPSSATVRVIPPPAY